LRVVKLPEAKKDFVLLPRRWVVERSLAWLARFRRLSRDLGRLPEVLVSLHFVAFVMLMLPKAVMLLSTGRASADRPPWLVWPLHCAGPQHLPD